MGSALKKKAMGHAMMHANSPEKGDAHLHAGSDFEEGLHPGPLHKALHSLPSDHHLHPDNLSHDHPLKAELEQEVEHANKPGKIEGTEHDANEHPDGMSQDRAPELSGHGDLSHEEGEKADEDANHHGEIGAMARSGGDLNDQEHHKIMQALAGHGSPIGRKSMTLGERAADKAKEKFASVQKHKKQLG